MEAWITAVAMHFQQGSMVQDPAAARDLPWTARASASFLETSTASTPLISRSSRHASFGGWRGPAAASSG